MKKEQRAIIDEGAIESVQKLWIADFFETKTDWTWKKCKEIASDLYDEINETPEVFRTL